MHNIVLGYMNINHMDQQQWKLSIAQVPWHYNYALSNASIGQILCCFGNILNLQPKKVYEEKLYEYLKPNIQSLLADFDNILYCQDQDEIDVKYYNLLSYLPNSVHIFPEEHGQLKLGKPRIGALIKALKQRIEFVLDRETPKMYLSNQNMLNGFLKMKIQLKKFLNDVRQFEQEFIWTVNEAHKAQQKYHK